MTFLPIVERELRVASRRRSTYLGRLVGAVIAMCIGGWIMMSVGNNAPGQLGMILFVSLSVMLFLYSLAAGARMTADCLSEEKREGTLGLLFLTDLKGYDIVAGKLVACSLNTFYGLLSAFPVLAISLLLGGVTSTEFWRVSLVAINLLFLSLSTGIFVSSLCRDERKATSLAFLILLLLLGATPLVELCLNIANHNRSNTTTWLVFSPAFSCFSAFGARLPFLKPSDFWTPMAMTQVYGWIFLGLASVIVPRSWQDKAASSPRNLRTFWKKLFAIDEKKNNARRTRLLEINPFLWLASPNSVKLAFLWATLLVLGAVWLWGWLKWQGDWLEIPNYIFTAVVLHTILKFWIASEACYRFVEDRKNSALELLLSTPLSVAEILRGQRLALFRQFSGPVIFVLAVDLGFLFLGLIQQKSGRGEDSLWIVLWAVGMIVFVMDLFALSWVSMWAGLFSKKINQASAAAVGRILVLPWIAFFISMTIAATASILGRINWDGKVVMIYWMALSIVTNVVCISWAKRNLNSRFRDMATQRFAAKTSRFGWMKSGNGVARADVPPIINLR